MRSDVRRHRCRTRYQRLRSIARDQTDRRQDDASWSTRRRRSRYATLSAPRWSRGLCCAVPASCSRYAMLGAWCVLCVRPLQWTWLVVGSGGGCGGRCRKEIFDLSAMAGFSTRGGCCGARGMSWHGAARRCSGLLYSRLNLRRRSADPRCRAAWVMVSR